MLNYCIVLTVPLSQQLSAALTDSLRHFVSYWTWIFQYRFADEKSTVDNYNVRGSTRFTLARLIIAIRFRFSFSFIRSSSIIGGSEYLSQMKSDTTITTNSSRQQSLISIVYLFFSSRNRELMRIVQRDPASSTDLNWRVYQPENRFALEHCARSRDIFIHH